MPTYYGKTVEEAIEEGLKELGITAEQAEIKVIEEAKKGFLGINTKKAEVEVNAKKTDGERVKAFLEGLFPIMNVNAKCNLVEEDDKIVVEVIAERSQQIIGYRGETLDALQTLAGAVANIGREDYRRVVVDCENYREKREDTLKGLAEKLADRAVREGRKVILEPMAPYERRIIHSALADRKDVTTESDGKEPNRHVVIVPGELTSDEPIDASFKGKRGDSGRNDRRTGRGDRGSFRGGKSGYGRDNRGGFRGNGNRGERAPRQPRPKTSGWGTFLGNANDKKD